MTRVAIIGSRTYRDLDRVRAYIRSLPEGTELVLAGADFSVPNVVADAAAEEGKRKGFQVHRYWPRPDLFASRAALMRGRLMVEESDRLVAFTTGSYMTEETIMYAARKGREVQVWPDLPEEKP